MSQKLTRREFGLAAGCFTVAAGGLVGSKPSPQTQSHMEFKLVHSVH